MSLNVLHVAGVGATGSHLTMSVAHSGVFDRIEIYDDDTVEFHNTNSVFNQENDVGNSKVSVLARKLNGVRGGVTVTPHNEKMESANTSVHGVAVVCVDSMNARRDIYNADRIALLDWFIDIRVGKVPADIPGSNGTGSAVGTAYIFDPTNETDSYKYRETLWADDEARLDDLCGQRVDYSFAVFSASIGAMLAKQALTKNPRIGKYSWSDNPMYITHSPF